MRFLYPQVVRVSLVSAFLAAGGIGFGRPQAQCEQIAEAAYDAVVLCPEPLLPALQPWVRHRKQQGRRLALVDSTASTSEIREAIRLLARGGKLRYVVIVGDADPAMTQDPHARALAVPTMYAEAAVVTRYGSEPLIASDQPFGDLDGDSVPELAVGRISADTPAELAAIVAKIIQYETQPHSGEWLRTLDFVAGVGGFGSIADSVIEGAAKRFITDGVPPEYHAQMTYGNWRSPFCPDPRRFRDVVLGRFAQGSLFWIYIGHGQPHRLDRLQTDSYVLPIVEASDVPRMQSRSGLPIAIMLACYTGAYDQPEDCIAERMLAQPRGPVAVIAGSRVTTPYGLAILASGLMDGYFHKRLPTLGDVLLHARGVLERPELDPSPSRKLVESTARLFSPTKDQLASERKEHQLLINLLGDPMLRLPYPDIVPLHCRRHAQGGDRLKVELESPFSGTCVVELICRRDQSTSDLGLMRATAETPEQFARMTESYHRANDKLWSHNVARVRPGKNSLELMVSPRAAGSCHVRVFVTDGERFALGASPLFVQQPVGVEPLAKVRTP